MEKLKAFVRNWVVYLTFFSCFAYSLFAGRGIDTKYLVQSPPYAAAMGNDYASQKTNFWNAQKNKTANKQVLVAKINQLGENRGNLMEMLLYFSRDYQVRSVANAIQQAGVESMFSVNESPVLKLENQSTPLTTSDNSSSFKTQNKINNYNALVSVGSGMEITNPLITVNSHCNLKEKLLEILTQDLTTQQAKTIEGELIDFFVEIRNKMAVLLQPAMEKYNLAEITFTDYRKVIFSSKYSGITMVTNNGRNVITNRQRLENFFQQSRAHDQYLLTQAVIDSLQNIRNRLIDFSLSTIDLLEFRQEVQQSITQLDLVNFDANPVLINKSITKHQLTPKITGLSLQIYSKPVFGVNGSFCFNLQNRNVSLGLGKAYFVSCKNSHFGFVTGLDCSANFHSENNNIFIYNGLKAKAFIGLGYRL